eukprot:SAG11_NODE_4266_length_1979_cov_1.548936_4_plen_22_part_01
MNGRQCDSKVLVKCWNSVQVPL